MDGVCRHGAVKEYCEQCNEVLDRDWDEKRDRRWDPVDRFVANPYIYKEPAFVETPPQHALNQPVHAPTEHDYSLAREMLRVAGSPQNAQTPQEAYEMANLIMATAHKTGGMTLKEFEKARQEREKEELEKKNHQIGLPGASKKKKRRHKKKASEEKAEPEAEQAQEEPQQNTAGETSTTQENTEPVQEEKLTEEEKMFLQELDAPEQNNDAIVPQEQNTAVVPQEPKEQVYHIKGSALSGVGSRVFTPVEEDNKDFLRGPTVAVQVNGDHIEGVSKGASKYPGHVLVHTAENPDGFQLTLDRVKLRCVCGDEINDVHRPDPPPAFWSCASCGSLTPNLDTPHAYWACSTPAQCNHGFCNTCYNIPYLRNNMPTWSSPYDPLTDTCAPPSPPFKPAAPSSPPPNPTDDKPKKKKKPSGKKSKTDDKKDVKKNEKGDDKKENNEDKVKDKDQTKTKADTMLPSSTLYPKKEQGGKEDEIVDPVYATRDDGKTLYSTSDGHWRVGSKKDERLGRLPRGMDGGCRAVEHAVRMKLDMYDMKPEKIAIAQARYGVTQGMVPKAVLGGPGVYARINLADDETPDSVVHELLGEVSLRVIATNSNPTGTCACGGKVELKFLTGTTIKHCDICDKLVNKTGFGFCSSCAFTVCTECKSEDLSSVLEVKRNGSSGLGGMYFLEGTNIIAMVEKAGPAEAIGVKRGMLITSINDMTILTDADAIVALKAAITEPLEISVVYHNMASSLITSPPHEGRLPHELGLGWKRKGETPHPLCGVSIVDTSQAKPPPPPPPPDVLSDSVGGLVGEPVQPKPEEPKKKKKKKKKKPEDEKNEDADKEKVKSDEGGTDGKDKKNDEKRENEEGKKSDKEGDKNEKEKEKNKDKKDTSKEGDNKVKEGAGKDEDENKGKEKTKKGKGKKSKEQEKDTAEDVDELNSSLGPPVEAEDDSKDKDKKKTKDKTEDNKKKTKGNDKDKTKDKDKSVKKTKDKDKDEDGEDKNTDTGKDSDKTTKKTKNKDGDTEGGKSKKKNKEPKPEEATDDKSKNGDGGEDEDKSKSKKKTKSKDADEEDKTTDNNKSPTKPKNKDGDAAKDKKKKDEGTAKKKDDEKEKKSKKKDAEPKPEGNAKKLPAMKKTGDGE
eukprot:TRINITY_DN3412_c0_g1_i1.p1 TRINITY_DN3412_c0_g1~~TRINITY_DN3412_c0_g1_i1.p1  ORF type:complete len:1128 (+),score=382.15 TRINITY_DN3412_c0_g1_i1:248-3631(+)